MMRFLSARYRGSPLFLACVAGMAGLPTLVAAQSTEVQPVTLPAPAIPNDTRRLTDQERQAILDGNTVESAASARGELPGSTLTDRRIHGEVGVMIGTGGTRGVYGAADIPLGDRAGATLSFESSRFAYRR